MKGDVNLSLKYIVNNIENDENYENYELSESSPFDVNEKMSDGYPLKEVEDKIKQYSNQLIKKKVKIDNKKFKMISSRLFDDILMIYMSKSILCDTLFNVVENLKEYYRNLYLETKAPIARFYEGKFSVVYELYHTRIINDLYDKIINDNTEVKEYLFCAMVDGMCNIGTNITEKTQKDLNWLEENDFISIYSLNGYTIRLNDKYKFKITLENKKYWNLYYVLMKSGEKNVFSSDKRLNSFIKLIDEGKRNK